MTEPLHLVLHPVRADRVDDFQRFLNEVIRPAVAAERPHLEGRLRVLRSTEPSDGVVTYAFLLEGGDLAEDWELDDVLVAHYGEAEAERLTSDWVETFAPLTRWAQAAASAGGDSNQAVWTLEAEPSL